MLGTLSLMGGGFISALNPINILAIIAGTTIGIVIGCLPGLSAAMGVALLLPMTFSMGASTGLIILGAIYCGAIFGGSISAILIHTPGTPASAATAIEGYQMTLQGKAGKALGTACIASFFGGLLSCISLYFFAPILAQLAMKFGSPEYFWLSIFGLTIIAGVSSKSMVKGLISGALGLLLSTIGMDPMEGVQRFMFGQSSLYEGINVTCALIGLFSMSQALILAEKEIRARGTAKKFKDRMLLNKEEIKQIAPTVGRSWIIGNLIGILPGAGASIACFLGYNTSRQFSKHKEEFGHGSIEGVAGSEAANNAVTGGSLIPMLTLGIPGESVTAVLMGGLIIQGLTPGPDLFVGETAKMTYTFFAGFVLTQFAMLGIGLLGCRIFAQISRLSDAILIPAVSVLCVVGSYAIHKNFLDVVIMMIFGVLGYLLRKFDLNNAAVVLALILGPIGEKGLRTFKMIYEGIFYEILDHLGNVPLPPYIKEKLEDPERYQTVYAKVKGSAAAPTAGLHFTDALFAKIKAMGVEVEDVTLHVGLGTFRPMDTEDVLEHHMHSEFYHIDAEAAEKINRAKDNGGRVICVGTTSCRTVESAADENGRLRECSGWTEIFIYPGYKFKILDALITNFHLPESTLIMLVSALAGREHVLNAYQEAIEQKYRFFSFGDAMFIK